jgi:hypothetical protein
LSCGDASCFAGLDDPDDRDGIPALIDCTGKILCDHVLEAGSSKKGTGRGRVCREGWDPKNTFERAITIGIRNDGLAQIEVHKSLISGWATDFNIVSNWKAEFQAISQELIDSNPNVPVFPRGTRRPGTGG